MPKLDKEIEKKIDQLEEDGFVFPSEVRTMKAYFSSRTRKEAASSIHIHENTVNQILSKLKRVGILLYNDGVYEITDDYRMITRDPKPPQIKEDLELHMSEEERKWMLKNYKKYTKNRSEAARILGRRKFDICRMAIVLGIDQKN